MRKKEVYFLLCLVLVAFLPFSLLAQDKKSLSLGGQKKCAALSKVKSLERKWISLAKYAIPRTVLITIPLYIGGRMRYGYGSGAIISSDGYILTCTHVVERSERPLVVLSDGRRFTAKVLGWNYRQDYALIKIPARSLPYFPLGRSSKLKVGDWVMALGHPGGPYPDRQPAVSVGRITKTKADLILRRSGKFYKAVLRTDIPIFMGNSGGPLIDLEGKLVGINGAIILLNKNSYSIPIDRIKPDLSKLKAAKRWRGEGASWKDVQSSYKELRPGDIQRVYLNLAKRFFLYTFGKIWKTLKKWWYRSFKK
ncbi:MAG: hypothetical protein D6805_01055 [Planctomycetota bacterium]|nr:MAG: hypothetical protein D6805_01055 [Planctomycetota bacterium]